MRIVIDMQGAQSESRFRGIGRYTMSFALALARNAGEHEILLTLNGAFPESILYIREAFKELVPQENIYVFEVPLPVAEENPENEKRARVSELIREYFLEQLKPDIVLLTSLFEGFVDNAVTSIGQFSTSYKTVVILYDLIPFLHKEKYLPTKQLENYYMGKIDSLKKVDLLLSISESSKKEVVEALNIEAKKIQNISASIDDSFQQINLNEQQRQTLHSKYSITRKIIMYAPGGFDIRKNFAGLIEAYALLSDDIRQKYQLVIVSKVQERNRHYLNNLAKKAGLQEDELVLTGYVSDKDLIALYNTATLFIFPSEHEGFGLPVLEAMACGAPVIGSNTTSIPEVIGCEDALFDPSSSQSIASKIEQVLTDDDFRDTLIIQQQEHKNSFSWTKSALCTLEALEKNYQKFGIKNNGENDLLKDIATICVSAGCQKQDLIKISSSLSFNTINVKKQLLLDISEIVNRDAKSGIQRVVKSILSELLKNDFITATYDIKGIYFDGKNYRYANTFISQFLNTTQIQQDEVVEFKQKDIYLALDLNAHLTDVVHDFHKKLHYRGIKLYFIVYDILLIQHPEWWPEGISYTFEKWLRSIAEVSTGLICISNAVANEIKEWMLNNFPNRSSLPKITSFHLGADIDASIPSNGLIENISAILSQIKAKTTFLMVGTIEPRKGHNQTVEAFETLWTQEIDINLVIVGKEGWLVDDLVQKLKNHPELNKRLFWLEGISDEYLEKVYEYSTCLIAASEGEGFGLPLIESAQKNLPIIARNIPVFREVAGDFAYYFEDDNSPEVLTKTIKKWLKLYKIKKYPKSNKMPWLTWEESAGKLLKCLDIREY